MSANPEVNKNSNPKYNYLSIFSQDENKVDDYVGLGQEKPVADEHLIEALKCKQNNRRCVVCNTAVSAYNRQPYSNVKNRDRILLSRFLQEVSFNNINSEVLQYKTKKSRTRSLRLHRTCYALALAFRKDGAGIAMQEELRATIPAYQGRIPTPTEYVEGVQQRHITVNHLACPTCTEMVGWNSPFRRCTRCISLTYPQLLQEITLESITDTVYDGVDNSAHYQCYIDTMKNNYELRRSNIKSDFSAFKYSNSTHTSDTFTSEVKLKALHTRQTIVKSELTAVLISDLTAICMQYFE